ncbi:MAG: ABC transporter permease [Chloroflexi bacterium]|nr:ABC transporter permease [Chloroflexota bacterium]
MSAINNFATQSYLSYLGLFGWLNWPGYTSNVFFRPVLLMAMFSLAGRFAGDEGAAQRYAVGMIALSEMQIVQGGITQTFHYERQFGTLWVLFSSSGSRIVAYLSRGVLHYGNALLSAATTLLFAWLLFGVALPEADWAVVVAAVVLIALSSMTFSLMMGSFVIVLRDWFSGPALSYGLIIALTGAFIPRDALPAPLDDLGLLLPLTWALPALRDALGQGETDVAQALLGELGVAIAYLAVGLVLFRAVEWRARTNGTYDTV